MDGAELPSAPAGGFSQQNLSEYVTSFSKDNAGKSPTLVFFYTNAKRPGGRQPTRQAAACANLSNACFSGRDVKVGVAAKYYSCSRVDLTSVTPGQNPVFNTTTAPIVLVAAKDGSTAALLSGNISNRAVFGAMLKGLAMSGINAAPVIAEATRLLNSTRSLVNKQDTLTKSLARTKADLAKASSNPVRARSLHLRKAKAEAELAEIEKQLTAVRSRFDKLFG